MTDTTIFVEPSLRSRRLTAVLCTNVHSHRCFAHTVFDNCYGIRSKNKENTLEEPEGPKIDPDAENAIEPQEKCQARAHFEHVFEPQPFFRNWFQKNVSRSNTCVKHRV